PAVAVIYDLLSGRVTPLLKNCQVSASEAVWSPTGDQLAYQVNVENPEIRIYNVGSHQTQVLVLLDTDARIYGLSWSPDGQYLAFTQDDELRSIWVVSIYGGARQLLVSGGLLPNWSPDGKHILYARPGTSRLLDWYVLEVKSPVQ